MKIKEHNKPATLDEEEDWQQDEDAVLRVTEARYRAAFETSLDAIAICRIDDGMFVDVNRAFSETLGYSRDELVSTTSTERYTWVSPDGENCSREFVDVSGVSICDLGIWTHPEDWSNLTQRLTRHLTCRDYEAMLRSKDGSVFNALICAALINLEGVACIHLVCRDVSDKKEAEDKIYCLSYFDSVTGMPNREMLREQLGGLSAAPSSKPQLNALLTISLDALATISEVYGLAIADQILQEGAQRIASCIRSEADTVARISAREFAVLLTNLGPSARRAIESAQEVASRILHTLAVPYLVENEEFVSASNIGIHVFDSKNCEADTLLQMSAIALAEAKAAGRNKQLVFTPKFQEAARARATLERELLHALRAEQLRLFYQAQYHDSQLIGAEALIRWKHPRRGVISPGEFIPLAEESGQIVPLGEWVARTACKQIAAWNQKHIFAAPFRVAINISAQQFRQCGFVPSIIHAIQSAGADPHSIELELTETTLIDDVESVVRKMQELKEIGVHFSLDDFGTGYSCLAYLKRLPLDKLKIDISFTREILTDPGCAAIAKAIISMSDALGLTVIAEGVESVEQRDYLLQLGCRYFQGFLYGPPLPAQEFVAFSPGAR